MIFCHLETLAAARYHRKLISLKDPSPCHFPKSSKILQRIQPYHCCCIIQASFHALFNHHHSTVRSFSWLFIFKHLQWQKLFRAKSSCFKPDFLHHPSFRSLRRTCFESKLPNNDCITTVHQLW